MACQDAAPEVVPRPVTAFKSGSAHADTEVMETVMHESFDQPAERMAGLSARRERLWGLVGGVIGGLAGVGSFLIAWVVQGAPLRELAGSPYPPFFAHRTMMALDYYFLGLVVVGLGFLFTALVALRFGRYPRTDGSGAGLIGTILCALGGVVLFMRLWAVFHG
jgi:hypothetical protein